MPTPFEKALLTGVSEIEGGTFRLSARWKIIHMTSSALERVIGGNRPGRLPTAGRARSVRQIQSWTRDQFDAAKRIVGVDQALLDQAEAGPIG